MIIGFVFLETWKLDKKEKEIDFSYLGFSELLASLSVFSVPR